MKISVLAMWAKTTRYVGQVGPHSEHVMIHYSLCGPVTHLLPFPLLAMWAPLYVPEGYGEMGMFPGSESRPDSGEQGADTVLGMRAAPKRPSEPVSRPVFFRLESDRIEER